ncbi:hypothetical protein ES703_62368 [subsurface metagenome]
MMKELPVSRFSQAATGSRQGFDLWGRAIPFAPLTWRDSYQGAMTLVGSFRHPGSW